MPRRRRTTAQDEPEASEEDSEQRATQRQRITERVQDDGSGESEQDENQIDISLDRMVKNLVRLALACEYSRIPIRRADIAAKVLGSQSRQFKAVFAQAQQELRAVFAMEMVELPTRDKITIAQKRAAAKAQSVQKTSSAWVLTSTLPSEFRTPDILPPPQVPTAESESQYSALYSFIISLILLSGGTLADSRLDRYLSRVNVNEVTPFANPMAVNAIEKTEKLLKRMEKDGYIVKIKDNAGGDETIDWVVGPRGKVEVGDQGVRGLVKTVYGDTGDEAELEKRLERSLGVIDKAGADEQERS